MAYVRSIGFVVAWDRACGVVGIATNVSATKRSMEEVAFEMYKQSHPLLPVAVQTRKLK